MNQHIPDIANGYGNTFTVTLSHGNTSPSDSTNFYIGWRYGVAGESGSGNNPYSNKGLMPNVKAVIRGVQISWRASNTPSLEVVQFKLWLWDSNGVLKSQTTVLEAPFYIPPGLFAYQASASMEDVHTMPGDQVMISYNSAWVTNPLNLLITAQLFCERVL